MQNRNRDTDIENKIWMPEGEGRVGRIETGINIYTLK